MLPVAQIICYTLILGAAVLHYFHWRVSSVERNGETGVRLTGWLTVGLVLGASHGLVVAVTGDAEWHLAGVRWPRVTLLVVLSVLCLAGAGGRAGGRARRPRPAGRRGRVLADRGQLAGAEAGSTPRRSAP